MQHERKTEITLFSRTKFDVYVMNMKVVPLETMKALGIYFLIIRFLGNPLWISYYSKETITEYLLLTDTGKVVKSAVY